MIFTQPLLKFEIYYNLTKYELTHAPNGWDKCEFTTAIDTTYNTTYRKFSSSLTFVFEAQQLLKKIFYTQGANATALLRILKLDPNTLNYVERVLNNIDFSKIVDTIQGTTVELLDNGILANIKAYSDVVYTIPVDSTTNAIPVNIGGIQLNQSATFAGSTSAPHHALPSYVTNVDNVDSSIDAEFGVVSSQLELNSSTYFFTANKNLTIRVTGHIENVITDPYAGVNNSIFAGARGATIFRIIDTFGNIFILGKQTYISDLSGHNPHFTFDFDTTINVLNGAQLQFQIYNDRYISNGTAGEYFSFDEMNLKIEFTSFTNDYLCQGLRGGDLFRALMKKINPDPILSITTNLLDIEWNTLVMLSGDNIRGIRNGSIQTNFNDFFKSVSALLFAGFKVYSDGSIRLEKRTFFFNSLLRAGSLGRASKVKYESINSCYYSKITCGYTDQEYQTVQGKDEICNEEDWSSPITKNENNIEIKSAYRADARGVDQLLIDFRADPTVDTKEDNETFMFQINEEKNIDGYYHLLGPEQYQHVGGVSALGRIYNLNLTGRHMLIRNSPFLSVQYAVNSQGSIVFQSSSKNADLVITDFSNKTVAEKDSIVYSDMISPMYLPIQATGTFGLTDDDFFDVIVNAEQTGGYVEFIDDLNKQRKGFPVGNTFNLTKDNVKEVVFYLTTDNDLIN